MNPETTPLEPASQRSFFGLGIAPGILDILERMKFTVPTPIQYKAIPIAVEGKDVMGIAQTGTGKTLAFGIPMVQRLAQGPGHAVVVVPTRELALQVDETLRRLGDPLNIRTAVLIGGMNMNAQIHGLRKPSTRILIATPGRLLDHLERRTVSLNDVKMAVLDEADRMLDMGFAPAIQKIAKCLPKERQTLFFSATMPESILKLAAVYMKLPIRVEIARQGTAPEKIAQELFIVKQEAKRQLLAKLLEQYHGSVLIFSRTKAGARKTAIAIRQMNHTVNEIHANRSLPQRREALEGFKTGRYRVLVATDIAARGIDVKGIELVINYDLPDDSENYVHRIGRTGRAGREGRAITFATPDQGADVRAIEQLIRGTLPIATHPSVPDEKFSSHPAPKPNTKRHFFPGHRPSGGGQHSSFGGRRTFRR
ncbi:MAG TPA: DEAD/DEAH box helicase [Candidatus Eisenbacteria bacterium]|jgi:ATP-dependent RNA helicase RhlE|nr:DEAD/DEAH box helicase [Candidatus Eisenbacteria bacterium]